MARTVREIMNPELSSVHGDAIAEETLEMILNLGITAVPVLDDHGRPIGVTSLRDLVRIGPAKAPVTSPATTIALNASVASAAETMATTGRHHLVVVGADGRAVGMVSTLDVIRALLGYPARHPVGFPHQDLQLDAVWSNDEVFDDAGVGTVPATPGVLVLVVGGVDRSEEVTWASATVDLRRRAKELLDGKDVYPPALATLLTRKGLRFRYSVVEDANTRETLAARIHERLANAPPPGGT